MWTPDSVTDNPSWYFLPSYREFAHTCAVISIPLSTLLWRVTLWRSLEFFLCAVLSIFQTLAVLVSPDSILYPQLRVSSGLLLGFSFLCFSQEIFSGNKLRQYRLSLFTVLSSENHVFIYFVWFLFFPSFSSLFFSFCCFRQKHKSVSYYFILAKPGIFNKIQILFSRFWLGPESLHF